MNKDCIDCGAVFDCRGNGRRCKPCSAVWFSNRGRRRYAADPERDKAKSTAWRKLNPEASRAINRRSGRKNAARDKLRRRITTSMRRLFPDGAGRSCSGCGAAVNGHKNRRYCESCRRPRGRYHAGRARMGESWHERRTAERRVFRAIRILFPAASVKQSSNDRRSTERRVFRGVRVLFPAEPAKQKSKDAEPGWITYRRRRILG